MILLFFIGIVVKQKAVSEQELSVTLLTKFEGIFAGASLSQDTIRFTDISMAAKKA